MDLVEKLSGFLAEVDGIPFPTYKSEAEYILSNLIVRCKDCAWYDEWDRCVNSHCTKSYYGCRVPKDHFCSYGERKDDVG